MEREKPPALIECKKCGRQFSSVEALGEHSRAKHCNSSAAFRRSHLGRNAFAAAALLLVLVLGAGWYFTTPSQTNPIVSQGDSNLAADLVSRSQPVLGDKNAPVTIVEFGDFQCPTCGEWFRTQEQQIIQNLIKTGKAKLLWVDFDFYGPDSTYASEAAYAAQEQGKFWEFHDLLYSNQQTPNNGWASKSNLRQFAQKLGLDMTRFDQSIQSGKYIPLIEANHKLGTRASVNGTPTFLVIGPNLRIITIAGGQPYSVFAQAVNSLVGS